VRECDEIDAELWEIAENLHRAELTVLERDTQVARWITLKKKSDEKGDLRQPDAKPQGGRPEGGVRAAAREIGVSEPDARRAIKVAKLSDEARRVAREVGLDDNRTALLAAAGKETPEEQAEALRERAARPAKIIDIPEPKDWSEVMTNAFNIRIDENLCRSELTEAEEARCLAKRKELWEAREKREADAAAQVGKVFPPVKPRGHAQPKGFAAETAEVTGQSKRSINSKVERAEKIDPGVLDAITGGKWDKGVVLDILKKLTHAEQRQALARGGAGEAQG
jgi:hypothetical protein